MLIIPKCNFIMPLQLCTIIKLYVHILIPRITTNISKFTYMSNNKGSKKVVNISAATGRYLTKTYAQTHPTTTVKLHVKKGKP